MIWDIIIHNVNAMSNRVGLDICRYDTYWVHQVWDEAKSGLVFKIMNKPGTNKGGQIVIVTGVGCVRPRAYVDFHQINTHSEIFEAQGTNEVHMIIDKLEETVVGNLKNVGVKKIYDNQP